MGACERCGVRIQPGVGECPSCGLPVAFMSQGGEAPGAPEVIEPEIVDGFDPGVGARPGGAAGPLQLGCTLGPGCGCLALPLAVVGAVVAASALAFAWLLRIGETVGAAVELIARALGGGRRGPRGGPPAR